MLSYSLRGYTEWSGVGQKARATSPSPIAQKVCTRLMSRFLLVLILLVLIVFGALFALSRMNSEKPLTKVEKVVPNEKLAH